MVFISLYRHKIHFRKMLNSKNKPSATPNNGKAVTFGDLILSMTNDPKEYARLLHQISAFGEH